MLVPEQVTGRLKVKGLRRQKGVDVISIGVEVMEETRRGREGASSLECGQVTGSWAGMVGLSLTEVRCKPVFGPQRKCCWVPECFVFLLCYRQLPVFLVLGSKSPESPGCAV